ncbi:MAG TPA: DUF6588 family protein [Fibrobacteria bacterium]|nr:DUF6588 family protein [Fibrobacteria bacterium]
MRLPYASFAVIGLAASLLSAQSMEKAVAKIGAAGAKAYLKPVVTAFGSNMNAGWYHHPPQPVKYGFQVRAGLGGSGTLLRTSDAIHTRDRMALDTSLSNALIAAATATPAQRDSLRLRLAREPQDVILEGPAVTGDEGRQMRVIWTGRTVATGVPGDSVFIPSDTVTITNLNGLLDGMTSMTLFAPQINLGTLYGTHATLRWLPHYELRDEVGPIQYFGFGIQHNPAVWLKPGQRLPVDLSLGFAHQSLEGSFFQARTWSSGLHVSKSYGWAFAAATPYLGAQYERASFDVAYDLTAFETTHRVKTTIHGENTWRLTGGVSLRLLAIHVNVEASYAENPSAAYNIMIGI